MPVYPAQRIAYRGGFLVLFSAREAERKRAVVPLKNEFFNGFKREALLPPAFLLYERVLRNDETSLLDDRFDLVRTHTIAKHFHAVRIPQGEVGLLANLDGTEPSAQAERAGGV